MFSARSDSLMERNARSVNIAVLQYVRSRAKAVHTFTSPRRSAPVKRSQMQSKQREQNQTTKTATYMLAEISRNISLLTATYGAAALFAIPWATLATML